MTLDFSRCRDVWIPSEERWSPPPPHVRIGVERIVASPYLLLGDAMGGMKTAQAIIAAQFLHDADVIDRVIVVTIAACRRPVWFDEELGQMREQLFDDKNNFVSEYHRRIRSWQHGPKDAKQLRWIVTNYEFIRRQENLATLFQYCGPKTMLVLDESSAVRGYDSAQTEACMLLRWQAKRAKAGHLLPILGRPRCGRVLEMNGTPISEGPQDMFSQGNLLHPDVLECRYVTHYRARYAIQVPVIGSGGRPIDNGYGKPAMTVKEWTNLEDLQRRFAPYVLRREAKELGIDFALPPVGLDVELTTDEWKAYVGMRDEMVAWLKQGVATAAQAGVKSIRLAQITSGFVGGVEDPNVGDDFQAGDVFDLPGSFLDGVELQEGGAKALNKQRQTIVEVGRAKLDFALAWHAERLRADPDVKLLTWCRFVPELKRYLKELRVAFPEMPVGALCGEKAIADRRSHREEREDALRLFHPKTAPKGPATVAATQGTGAMGQNLTACRDVLDLSYDFSPWKKTQGDARVNRPGQTGPVNFHYLRAVGPKGQKTIDHHILMHRAGKTNVNDWTVAAWASKLMEE